jgi:hypothetical protein
VLEQEEFLERLLNPPEVDAIKAKIGAAAQGAAGVGPEKPVVPKRPTKRAINHALLSLKRNDADTHDDGLTKEQRAWAWKVFRWLLGIPVNGKSPRVPVKLRRYKGSPDDDGGAMNDLPSTSEPSDDVAPDERDPE